MTHKAPKTTNFAVNSSEIQTVKSAGATTTGRKFYQLEHAEFLEMRSQLTPAERDILLYLRTLDPFGDKKLDLGIREIGRTMALNASTVSRAMKVLDAKGYIDMEVVSVRFQIRSLGSLGSVGSILKKAVTSNVEDEYVKVTVQNNGITEKNQETYREVLAQNDSVVSAQHHGSECNTLDLDATPLILMQHLGVEIQSDQGFQQSKTSNTINTFKDQIDRQDYFNFEEVENTLKPIVLKPQKSGIQEPKLKSEKSQEIKYRDLETTNKCENKPEAENKNEIANNQENKDNQLIAKSRVVEPEIDPDAGLKKFIINTVETKKGVRLTRPNEYVAKCLEKDRQHWESLYRESLKPPYRPKESRLDFYAVEVSISLAIKYKDLEFAIGRFKNYPELADQLLERHPDWRELLNE
jgi:hypothetical protein